MKKYQHYYEWLKDEKTTLYDKLMEIVNALELISNELIESWHLTPEKIWKIHKKVLGGLLYEIKQLNNIHDEILNRGTGGCIVDIKRYKYEKR